MKIRAGHIDFAELADLAEGRIADPGDHSSHLSECSRCATELQRLQGFILLMTADASEDAPRDVMQNAINIFSAQSESRQPSLLRRIVASLTFDSMTHVPAFGLRSADSSSRQMIFSAAENDIDLRVTREGNTWLVAGQVLGGDCSGGEVTLESESTDVSTLLNDLCEFRMPAVASGNYTLRLRLGNLEVEVPQIELRA